MTTDRSEELIRAMLERRAATPPPWLGEEAMRAVGAARQRHAGGLDGSSTRQLALVAAAVALLVIVVAGAAIAAGLVKPFGGPPPEPSLAVPPSSSPTTTDAPSSDAPSETPSEIASLEPVATPSGGTMPADSIAVVTTAGDQLRVRSAPGTGGDSKRLEPLLGRGTRMLVLDGPVAADGHDWYQVYVPNERMAGWVASGDGDVAWIRGGKTRCPEQLDAEALYGTSPIDLLLCFRDRPVDVEVRDVGDYETSSCDLSSARAGCTWTPKWFGHHGYLFVGETSGDDGPGADMGAVETVDVVLGPDVAEHDLDAAARGATVTLSFDHPEARQCRVRNKAGTETLEPWQAVLACRLKPIVESVQPSAGAGYDEDDSPDVPVTVGQMATLVTDGMQTRPEPDPESGPASPAIREDAQVYVADRRVDPSGLLWWRILVDEFTDTEFGWIPAYLDDSPTLVALEPTCWEIEEWLEFMSMTDLERLACYGDESIDADLWANSHAPHDWYHGCAAAIYRSWAWPSDVTSCYSEPAWLAGSSGLDIGGQSNTDWPVAYAPGVDVSQVAGAPRWMHVTGAFANAGSDECHVRGQPTGVDLLDPDEAAIWCRTVFVVTGLEPATTEP